MEDPKTPQSAHEEVKRQLRGALSLLLVAIVATSASVWMSVKYNEVVFRGGSSGLAAASAAPAGTIPLSGWAWSGGDSKANGGQAYMGWISMSSDNVAGEPIYGVYENTTTGVLSGYAWSSNLGWINFNAATGCPGGGDCTARINLTTQRAEGWVRACAAFPGDNCSGSLDSGSGNWDGWISLSSKTGEPAYGITQNPDCTWTGYAWGSDNIGWINFGPGGTGPGVRGPANHSACSSPVPDLTTGAVTPTSIAAGPTLKIFSSTVTNSGTASTSGLIDGRFERAQDASGLGAQSIGGVFVRETPLSHILGSNSFVATTTYATSSTGTFYARACADTGDQITESNEGNNCGPAGASWTRVDVVAPDLKAGPIDQTTATVGTPISFSAQIMNEGGAATGAGFTINFQRANAYNSSTDTATDITLSIGTGTRASSQPLGTSGAVTMTTPYSGFGPGDAGTTRWIRACADKSALMADGPIIEYNAMGPAEGNNCGPWTAVAVTSNQIVPNYKMSGTPTLNGSPVAGQPITFSARVMNASSTAATSTSNIRFQVDANAVSAPWGTPLWTGTSTPVRVVPALAGGATDSARASQSYTVPATVGTTYRVRACADLPPDSSGYIGEGSENDNCGAATPFTVLAAGAPELTSSITVATPGTVRPGQSFTLSGSVNNNAGTASATNFPSVFRIKNQAGDVTYIRLHAGTTTLAVGASSAVTSRTYSTTTQGVYQVDLCVNMNTVGVVPYIGETYPPVNNCGEAASVLVTLPDLTASAVTPTTVAPGAGVAFTTTINNSGAVATGSSFPVNFQKADDADPVNPLNLVLSIGSGTAAILAGGNTTQTVTMSAAYTVPSTGVFYVRACADKTTTMANGPIDESDEGDNCGDWTPIVVGTNCVPNSGTSCSVSNSCGSDTNNGVISCNGSCSATPPSEAGCDDDPPGGSCTGSIDPNALRASGDNDPSSGTESYTCSPANTSVACEFTCNSGYVCSDISEVCVQCSAPNIVVNGVCINPDPGTVPSVTLTTDWEIAGEGSTVQLTWVSENVTSCSMTGTNGDSRAGLDPSGELTSGPLLKGTNTFTITCTGANGSDDASVDVIVPDIDD